MMTRRLTFLLMISAWTSVALAAGYEHHRDDRPLRIASVQPDRSEVKVYQRLTLDIDLHASYENAFDAGQIRVDVEVADPEGRRWTAPGFLYMPYQRDDAAKQDRLTVPAGEPHWQARLSFATVGVHRLVVVAEDHMAVVRYEPIEIRVVASDEAGMIRRHPTDHRYFATDDGRTWFAVGANVCWGQTWGDSGKHVFAYDDWFPNYAANGCNFARIWISLEWNDLALLTRRSGYDRIDLQRAWHLDHVLDLAEQHGLHLMLCFDAHGMLRTTDRLHGFWEMSPLHPDHGAPIEKPIEFFSNRKTLDAYRNRLRYLVARYGYSKNVFAWEFFNEVDLIDDYDSQLIASWHREMAVYLRSIDPWKHLITTSYANPRGDPAVDGLAELDFVQTHHYQASDIAADFQQDVTLKAAAQNRPHFHGEFGVSHSGRETGELDPNGIHLHNGLYSSVGLGSAGTAMTWWWDSYVHPRNLYPIWGSFARWIEGFDFIAQQVEPVEAELSWRSPEAPIQTMDFVLNVSDVSWSPAPYNRPTKVKIDSGGNATYDVKPAGILHGVRNHPDLHNPVTFEVDVREATRFIVDVGDVSGHGGAILQITLDRREALRAEFVDQDDPERGGSLSQFRGSYGIDLPAGFHRILVKCTGKDWLMVNAYRIPGIVRPAKPPLRVLGRVGRSEALVWLQNPDYTWSNAQREDFEPYEVASSTLVLSDLASGRWTVQHWDTQAGEVLETETLTSDLDGRLGVEIPAITWDYALKLTRE